jgi:hypothetical protein
MFFTVACFLSVLTSQQKGLARQISRIPVVVVMAIVLERLAVDPRVKRIMFAAMGSALIPLLASLGVRHRRR